MTMKIQNELYFTPLPGGQVSELLLLIKYKTFHLVGMTVTQDLSTAVSKAAGNYRAFCIGNKSLYLHIIRSYVGKSPLIEIRVCLIQHQINSQCFPNSP